MIAASSNKILLQCLRRFQLTGMISVNVTFKNMFDFEHNTWTHIDMEYPFLSQLVWFRERAKFSHSACSRKRHPSGALTYFHERIGSYFVLFYTAIDGLSTRVYFYLL